MSKKTITPQALLAEADRILVLDAKTRVANMDEAAAALKSRFGLSDFRARALLAKAARRRRYHLLVAQGRIPDDVRRATPSSAAREFGGSAPNIRRACALGLLKAEQDPLSRHWSFTIADFKQWLHDGKHTPGKSRTPP